MSIVIHTNSNVFASDYFVQLDALHITNTNGLLNN